MRVERRSTDELLVNALPDGSRVIIDSKYDRVFALNATAGAAWDACGSTTTLAEITESMREGLGPAVTEELAEQAILNLQEQNLVTTSQTPAGPSRRQVLASLGAIALPLVVSMTLAEQKAYANSAGSGGTTDGGSLSGWNGGDGGDSGDGSSGGSNDGPQNGGGSDGNQGDSHDGGRDHEDHLDHGKGSHGWDYVMRKDNGPHS